MFIYIDFQIVSIAENILFSMTYTTIMQMFMLLPHFELLYLNFARIASTNT